MGSRHVCTVGSRRSIARVAISYVWTLILNSWVHASDMASVAMVWSRTKVQT